jgi:adiponectin receptor
VTLLLRTHHARIPAVHASARIPPLRLGRAAAEFYHPLSPTAHLPAWKVDAALSIFLLSAVSCLALSSHFHLVQCRTKEVCNKAHRGDYVSAIAAVLAESSLILLT